MIDFLVNDLRIDFEELDDFDEDIILKYHNISKSKKINFLLKVIKEL